MSHRIMVLHGPNLNMLGQREPQVYGNVKLDDINAWIQNKAEQLNLELEIHQSNHEGVLVELIHEAYNHCKAILINPGAFTHYSISLLDALKAVELPIVEVHLSNIYSREEFRRHSVISPVVDGVISGLGPESYLLGLEAISSIIE